MCVPLEHHLRWWATDGSVKAVIIKAAGEKAFCAGGDIRQLADRGPDGESYRRKFWYDEYRCNTLIGEFPKPFIALIDGIFMGGGVGLSVHGSHRVISEFATFAMPETGIGLFPDVGGSYFLPRCPGELGLYLGLTGARLKGADILAAGVATQYVPRERLGELEPHCCRQRACRQQCGGCRAARLCSGSGQVEIGRREAADRPTVHGQQRR
jgi:enoyl-CoA hydratase